MFEDSVFDWDKMIKEYGEKEYRKLEESSPNSLPLDAEGVSSLKQELGRRYYAHKFYPESKEEYLNRFDKNIGECYSSLRAEDPPPELSRLCQLYSTMQQGILKYAEFDCNRTASFLFLPDKEDNNIYEVDRVFEELKLMEKQVDILYENALTDEEKVRASLFQGLRWLAIHPANDGNKRMMKMMLNQLMNHLGHVQDINHSWDCISDTVVKQALHGNNLSGMLKALETIYGVDLKVKEYEIPPYRIMPLSDHKCELNIEDTRLHDSEKFSNSNNYKKLDKIQVKKLVKKLRFKLFNKSAKKDLEKLNDSLDTKEALAILNKHEKLIDSTELANMRYIVASTESGFKPFLEEAMTKGVLSDELLKKDRMPIVQKIMPSSKERAKLADIFKSSTEKATLKKKAKEIMAKANELEQTELIDNSKGKSR